MLELFIEDNTLWDEKNEIFIDIKSDTLLLEHSLISISKWESKWEKSFFKTKEKTLEEQIDYIKCMTINKKIDPYIYNALRSSDFKKIDAYINAPMTATIIKDEHNKSNNGTFITSELIYYWMIALNIPFECEKWHINRLLTLISVCNIKNKPPKKMSRNEAIRKQAEINAARRKRLNTRG